MSTENYSYVEINQRLRDLVDEVSGGNASEFAVLVGVKVQTFHTYLKGRTPNAEAFFNICIKIRININWLLTGIGPKYINDQGDPQILDPDPEIAELMEGARRVLTSGNHIAFDALERNIRYFDHAIAAEKRADEAEKKIMGMEDDVQMIKDELARIKLENKRLDEEDEVPSSNEKAA